MRFQKLALTLLAFVTFLSVSISDVVASTLVRSKAPVLWLETEFSLFLQPSFFEISASVSPNPTLVETGNMRSRLWLEPDPGSVPSFLAPTALSVGDDTANPFGPSFLRGPNPEHERLEKMVRFFQSDFACNGPGAGLPPCNIGPGPVPEASIGMMLAVGLPIVMWVAGRRQRKQALR